MREYEPIVTVKAAAMAPGATPPHPDNRSDMIVHSHKDWSYGDQRAYLKTALKYGQKENIKSGDDSGSRSIRYTTASPPYRTLFWLIDVNGATVVSSTQTHNIVKCRCKYAALVV